MEFAWLIPALGLGAFVVLALFRGYLPWQGKHLSVLAIIAAFVVAWWVLFDFFRNRGYELVGEHLDVFRELTFGHAVTVAGDLTRRFLAGEVDKVLLVYSEFRSVAQQAPTVHQLLPIAPQENAEEEIRGDYLFEPNPESLLEALVPRHVNFQVWRALLESNAGEQAARMQAMDNATKNAGDLIDELTKEMNRERQSAITLELMDIIGGAEAVS